MALPPNVPQPQPGSHAVSAHRRSGATSDGVLTSRAPHGLHSPCPADLLGPPPDTEVIERVLGGEVGLFGILMRRYEQRLYRVVRAGVPNDRDAEAVLEHTYFKSYESLAGFRGQGRVSTWLSRQALAATDSRSRRRSPFVRLATRIAGLFEYDTADRDRRPRRAPKKTAARARVEATLDELPTSTCTVLVMREVEGMSTAETADCLGMSEESIKMRLLRARAYLHGRVVPVDRPQLADVFSLPETHGARIVEGVLWRLRYGRQ